MAYLIHAVDVPDSAALRAEHRPAHLEYLDALKAKVLAAGALLDDSGTVAHGSVIIVDTDDRAEAEAFAKNDPFSLAGVFAEVTITRWRKVYLDGTRRG